MRRQPHISNLFLSAIQRIGPDLLCPICNKLVDIDSAKTDENGHAVHEDCYVLKVKQTGARKAG